jgi:hypothetical protein
MPKFKIRSVNICDDVRTEQSGKAILIGVYNGVITFSKMPVRLHRLFVRVEYVGDLPLQHEILTRIRASGKKEMIEMRGNVTTDRSGEPIAISVPFGPIEFDEEHEFDIYFGVDDNVRKISSFSVRKMETTAK